MVLPAPLARLKPQLLSLQHIWRDVLAVLYPQSCQSCGAYLLETERELCTACIARLPFTHQPEHLYHNALRSRLYGQLTGAAALCRYEGLIQELIHMAKYHEVPFLAHRLGQELGRQLAEHVTLPSRTVLMPIPLHSTKLRQRGYNQAEWIARGMASVGPWQVDTKRLRRTRHTTSQTGLTREARKANVDGVFAIRGPLPECVAIVDDVITTGATILAAARTLQTAGAKDVFALALAEVDA